jgi:hypothetical protein
MAIRYEIAGEDVTLVLPLLIDGDGTTADDGTVAIKLRDHLGAIVYADTISLSEDTTEFLFSVAAHLNEKTRAFERRTITYRWTASGRPANRTVTYVLAGVALEKWRAFGFGLCGGLEIAWAFVAKRRMSPHRIIEPVDVASNGNFGR